MGDGNEVGRGMEVADGIAAKVEATASRICVWGSGVAACGEQEVNSDKRKINLKSFISLFYPILDDIRHIDRERGSDYILAYPSPLGGVRQSQPAVSDN